MKNDTKQVAMEVVAETEGACHDKVKSSEEGYERSVEEMTKTVKEPLAYLLQCSRSRNRCG